MVFEHCTVLVAGIQPARGRQSGPFRVRRQHWCRCIYSRQTKPRSVYSGWRGRACVFNGRCYPASATVVCHCIRHPVHRSVTSDWLREQKL